MVEIEYKDFPIILDVKYGFEKGTTLAGGDNPDHLTLLAAIDGTGKDVLNKLDRETIDYIEQQCYEDTILD